MRRFLLPSRLILLALVLATSEASAATVTCDGGDDTERLQAVLTEMLGEGGEVRISGTKPCVIHHDLLIPPKTSVRGGPTAAIVAAKSAVFERAVVRCIRGVTLSDLTIDAAPQAHAISCDGATAEEPIRLVNIRVTAAPKLPRETVRAIDVTCADTDGPCLRAEGVTVRCEAPAVALSISGPEASSAHLDRFRTHGCTVGMDVRGIRPIIRNAEISVSGPEAIGASLPRRSEVWSSTVRASGERASGLKVGPRSILSGNRISLQAAGGTAIHAGLESQLSSNFVELESADGARAIAVNGGALVSANSVVSTSSPGAVAFLLLGPANVLTGNSSKLAYGGDSTHVLTRSDQNVISSNSLWHGDWGARAPIFEGGPEGEFPNGARLHDNNMIRQRKACAVLQTGWHAVGNHCNWVQGSGTGFWIGSPGAFGTCSTHTLLSANTIHTATSAGTLVGFAAGRRCLPKLGGTPATLERCHPENDCGHGLKCKRTTCGNVAITDNLLMAPRGDTALIRLYPNAEFAGAIPRTRNIRVTGNSVAAGHRPLLEFPPDQPPRFTANIAIRDNTPAEAQTIVGWQDGFGDRR